MTNELIRQRRVVMSLARRDFQRKYVRNVFGILWAVIDPIVFVGILYLIFSSSFGNSNADSVPFIVYILCGYIAFDLFSNLQTLSHVIKDHDFMVKKMNFRTEILPAGRLLSCLMLHGIMMGIAILIFVLNGIHPNVYWIQLLYYASALSLFLLGASMLTSTVSLFFPDLSHFIPIITRVLFFITPVFWRMDSLPAATSQWLKLNPMVYIVNGYRDSLLYGRGFWHHPWQTLYFWGLTATVLWIGTEVHRRLRPHFAEVV